MDRRRFLIGLGIALIAGPAAITLKGCGSSSNNTPAAPANSFPVTSNPDNTGHSHVVDILFADLTTPPSGGKTYTSSIAIGHSHQITLNQQQLTDISNGGTDSVTSTTNSGHSHEWTIKKPA